MTFFDRFLKRELTEEAIDDAIREWHTSPDVTMPLHDFLGMSEAEYGAWVYDPSVLSVLAQERRDIEMTQEIYDGLPFRELWRGEFGDLSLFDSRAPLDFPVGKDWKRLTPWGYVIGEYRLDGSIQWWRARVVRPEDKRGWTPK